MVERRLYFTPGSPFGRAIRIMLDEIGLPWQAELANIADTPDMRAQRAPTLQVPTYFEGSLALWDSSVIAEYLLTTYAQRVQADGSPPLAPAIARAAHHWQDRLLFATVQTLGQSTVLVSQMRWSGVTPHDSGHVARNVDRIQSLFGWFDAQLPDDENGFMPEVMSVQDIFLVCHIMFITHRPLEISWDRSATPKLAALHDRLAARRSFQAHPIAWWEPGMPT